MNVIYLDQVVRKSSKSLAVGGGCVNKISLLKSLSWQSTGCTTLCSLNLNHMYIIILIAIFIIKFVYQTDYIFN